MTDPPSASYAAGVAIRATVSGGLGTFIALGGLTLNLNGTTGQTQQLVFQDLPNTVGSGNPIHLTQLRLVLLGATGGAKPLVTNPSACPATAASATVAATAIDGSSAQAVIPYSVTNCASIPASQAFDVSLSDPTFGHSTDASFTLDVPAGSSAISRWSIAFGRTLAIDTSAYGHRDDVCASSATPPTSPSAFNPSSCPPQAKVGTVTITSPVLHGPVTGDVYATYSGYGQYFGIDIQSAGVTLRSASSVGFWQFEPSCNPQEDVCESQTVFSFAAPDIPITRVKFDFGLSGRMSVTGYELPRDIWRVQSYWFCTSPESLASHASFKKGGSTLQETGSIELIGCP